MESANLHHQQHQLQDQLLVGSSSSSSSLALTPSCYGVASTIAWTPNTALNYNDNSLIHDLGLNWPNHAASFTSQSSAHDLHLAKIKEEFSSESLPKFTEMLNSPSSIEDSHQHHLPHTSYPKNEQKDHLNDLSEKLLLKTISSGFPINGHHHDFSAAEFFSNTHNCSTFGSAAAAAIPSRGNFSQIYPSVNISSLNRSSSSTVSSSSSYDMNLHALDLLTNSSARSSGSFHGMYKESNNSNSNFGLDHQQLQQQSSNGQSCSPSILSSYNNEVPETKRSNSLTEPKESQSAPKKTRLETRSSCPPFKVRKEKLGDRIAALQQLVAPFGKTDTASVLMEAIGYIKFLQNQVETLSVPYMKSSRNKNSKTMQGGSISEDGNHEEPKRDLRSRGLCLVPLSCMSYVTSDGGGAVGGGGIWPPPNFGGGT